MTSQAKPTQTLEEMARETCGCQDCAKWGHEEKCKAVDIAAIARQYANQVLREAAGKLKEQGSRVGLPTGAAADLVLSMIEGEP